MGIELIGIILLMGVAMYFLMIRPARKQQAKQQEIMNSLAVGSRVMLGSGIYGTIRHLGEKQAVIEISPGVDLTIVRAAIRNVVPPEEEEFEYTSEPDEIADTPDTSADTMAAYEADVASPFAAPAPEPEAGADPAGDEPDKPDDAKNNDEK